MNIPDIVKQHVLKNCKRMPETEREVNEYLDLINQMKKYEQSLILESCLSKRMMKKLGLKSPKEIEKETNEMFNKTPQQ